MSVPKGKLSQIRSAFKKVYETDQVDDNDIIKYTNEIIFYAGQYPFENNELTQLRLVGVSDVTQSDKILDYLSQIENFEFDQRSTYGKLFEIGRKYGIGYKVEGSEELPLETKVEEPTVKEDIEDIDLEETTNIASDSNDHNDSNSRMEIPTNPVVERESKADTINNIKEKGEQKMSTNPITELANSAGVTTGGVGQQLDSNVKEISKADVDAAKALIISQQEDRMNFSKQAKIKKVLIVSISKEQRAEKGRKTMGRINKPELVLATFREKTGLKDLNGEIKFTKLHSSQSEQEALEFYELLKKAVENPDTEIAPYFGKENESAPVNLKGVEIETPAHKMERVQQSKIAGYIVEHAMGYIDVDSKSNAQFQLNVASPRSGSKPKKSFVTAIANRKALLEDTAILVPVKILKDDIIDGTGFKSEKFVVCEGALDANNKPKKLTWRAPLMVRQHEEEVVAGYDDLFNKSGAGNTVTRKDLDSENTIKDIVNAMTSIIASEAANTKSILSNSISAQLEQEKVKAKEEQSAAINQNLEDAENINEADF